MKRRTHSRREFVGLTGAGIAGIASAPWLGGAAAAQTPSGSSGGDALASLMVGFAQGGNGYGVDVAVTTQNFAHAWYFQDNWRPTNRLTINLGLRYELTLPRTERYNRMSWIDPNVASPLQVPGKIRIGRAERGNNLGGKR